MRIVRNISALIACAALLAGCGGGGNTSPTAHMPAVPTAATSAPTGVPLATAKLTIKFPANFHTARNAGAKTAAASTRSAATSPQKSPAYVNPTASNYIDVFVNGVDETAGTMISNTADGTQTIPLPLYSNSTQQIVAVETQNGASQGYNAYVLAIGETDLPGTSFQPGDVTSIGLTMLMNAYTAGITSDPTNGTDATINTYSGSQYPAPIPGCNGYPATTNPLYLVATDHEGGFYANAGLGVTIPSLSGAIQQTGTYPVDSIVTTGGGQILNNGAFEINFPGSNGGLILNAVVTNPAAAIQQDAYNDGNVYPGIDSLYQGGSFTGIIQTIYSSSITTQIYVQPYQSGC